MASGDNLCGQAGVPANASMGLDIPCYNRARWGLRKSHYGLRTMTSGRPLTLWYRLALIATLLIGFGLRVYMLDTMPPFAHGDDAALAEYSLQVASGNAPLLGVRPDGDPNLAFVLFAPYAWFGGNLYALRIVAAMWSVLTLAVIFFTVRKFLPLRVALFAVGLLAVSHMFTHFGRIATIVVPSTLSSFLTIGLLYYARRQTGGKRFVVFALSGAVLALNLYVYIAAKAVGFAIAVLWLLVIPRKRSDWRPFLLDLLPYAAVFLLLAIPVIQWYLGRPADLVDRLGFLSVFAPRNAVVNLRLYGNVDTFGLLYYQTLRSIGGFFVTPDTSPNYHFDAALLDPGTAGLFVLGLVLLALKKRAETLMLAVWMAAGLIAGAILLVEPPTSYHYIVLVPIAAIFAACALDWLASARRIGLLVPLGLLAITVVNTNMYFNVYPTRGAWYSLESDVGFYVRTQRDCCAFWYIGDPEVTPRKITALIANPAVIHYVRDHDELDRQIVPYLGEDANQVIIVPYDKIADSLPRLKRRFPEGREYNYSDRGRRMFCTYTLPGRRARQGIIQRVPVRMD
jgi:4-amino-4-deoxy-L-arabinose transferase-like glycosyltransferase